MKSLITTVLFGLTTLGFAAASTPAHADHQHPLTAAACEYRDSVQHFERQVHRLRYLDRYDVRLVERLENAACDFFGASHRIDDPSRLLYHWNEIQSLQPRVTESLFGRACYPVNPQLEACWREVLRSYDCVERELRCLSHVPSRWQHFGGPSASNRAPIGVPHHAYRPSHDWLGEPSPFPIDRLNSRRLGNVGALPPSQFQDPRIIAVPPARLQIERRDLGADLGAAVVGSLLNRLLSR